MKTLLTLALLLFATTTQASQIIDGGGLFDLVVKDKALKTLESLEETTKVETIIETIPFSEQKTFSSDAVKSAYFNGLLKEKAAKRKATGLFILICRTPGRIEVQFAKEMNKTRAEQDNIRNDALVFFRKEDWNGGLNAIVERVGKTLPVAAPVVVAKAKPIQLFEEVNPQPAPAAAPAQAQVPQAAAVNEGSSMGWIIAVVLIMAAAAVGLIYLFRPKDIVVPDADNNEELYRPRQNKKKEPRYEEPVRYTSPSAPVAPQIQVIPNNNDLVTGMMLGHMMNQSTPAPAYVSPTPAYTPPPRRRDPDPEPTPTYDPPSYSSPSPSYDPPSPSYDSSSFSSFDGGGSFDSGGSSGGDF